MLCSASKNGATPTRNRASGSETSTRANQADLRHTENGASNNQTDTIATSG